MISLRGVNVLTAFTVLAELRMAEVSASFRRCHRPEIIARKVQDWIGAVGAKTANIEPGSP